MYLGHVLRESCVQRLLTEGKIYCKGPPTTYFTNMRRWTGLFIIMWCVRNPWREHWRIMASELPKGDGT